MDYVLLEGYSDLTAKRAQLSLSMLILKIFCLCEESQTCVYLKSQMDTSEIEKGRS